MKRFVLGMLLGVLTADFATGAPISTGPTSITDLHAYTTFGGGDVVFRITGYSGNCYGFWLRAADGGFKTAYATLMAASLSQTPVSIYAYDDEIWTGSGSAYCRVGAVMPQ